MTSCPLAEGVDPLCALRGRIGQRQVQIRDTLAGLPARADRDDLLIIGHVDPLDFDFDVEHHGLKGHHEVSSSIV